MVTLAGKLNSPEYVPLLPRFRALANAKVVSIPRKGKPQRRHFATDYSTSRASSELWEEQNSHRFL